MKYSLALSFFLLLAGVAAVRAQDVAVDFDSSSDFSKFKTYSWTAGIPAKNPLIDQQIRSNIEGQLATKGLRRVEEGGDLSVMYFAAVDKELQVATAGWANTGNWSSQMRTGISVRSQSWDVDVGTLVVCLSADSGKNLLWRGTASATLDKKSRGNRNPLEAMTEEAKKAEKTVRKSVEKMFKKYPAVKSHS